MPLWNYSRHHALGACLSLAMLSLALLSLALLGLAATAQATTVRHWKRTPIAIKLPVGHERIVVFNTPVRIGLPPQIADEDVLRVQSTGGAVYLQAKQEFDTQRVQIQDLKTGRIMLFDLTAAKQASTETVQIEVDASPAQSASEQTAQRSHGEDAPRQAPAAAFSHGASQSGAPLPIRLVRHAAQALYAPQRLLTGAAGVQRVAVAHDALPGLLPAYPVQSKPLAAWRAAPYTVTAIQVTNRDPARTFRLDPRGLAGDFYAASFMYETVGPAGSLADTTTLFAVTKNASLADALLAPLGQPNTEADDGD